jgi:Thoeris protein ThsB, TIR-like domain
MINAERRLSYIGKGSTGAAMMERLPPPRIRRKVFISYFRADRPEVEKFVDFWGYTHKIFIPQIVGACGNDIIDSQNADYVIGRIRREQIADSSVTLVLIGNCTHSRRHVDWEIKASLRQGEDHKPNGLLGILLPSQGKSAYLPPRFKANWNNSAPCYALYKGPPSSGDQLAGWINDAYLARENRAHLIQNTQDMMKYNSECLVCKVTHSLRTSARPRFRLL